MQYTITCEGGAVADVTSGNPAEALLLFGYISKV